MPFHYFDNASTTKTDPRVLEAMLPYFSEMYGNTSSNHEFGKESKQAIELSRKQVTKLINASENQIIFTSGATESINFGIVDNMSQNKSNINLIFNI